MSLSSSLSVMDTRSVSFKNSKKSSPIWQITVNLLPTIFSDWYGRRYSNSKRLLGWTWISSSTHGLYLLYTENPGGCVCFLFRSRTVRMGGVSLCLARRSCNINIVELGYLKQAHPHSLTGRRNETERVGIVKRKEQIETANCTQVKQKNKK